MRSRRHWRRQPLTPSTEAPDGKSQWARLFCLLAWADWPASGQASERAASILYWFEILVAHRRNRAGRQPKSRRNESCPPCPAHFSFFLPPFLTSRPSISSPLISPTDGSRAGRQTVSPVGNGTAEARPASPVVAPFAVRP